jgi:glycosyltransferase involved in cell wall biosynthesis
VRDTAALPPSVRIAELLALLVPAVADAPADPAALERLGLKPRGYVLALANTQPHKNVRVLLEAFRHPSLQQLKLVLFGSEGPEAFEARGLAVPPGVIHAGRVSDAELRGLYDQALCLGFPSTTEGFGLPPLEAMQVGCPAVVAPCGALPEVCGPAALYADPGNPQAWVQAIADLAGNTIHREERVAAGRSRAAMFTWDRAAGRLIEELLAL